MSSRLTDFTQWDPQLQHSQHYTYANSFKMSYYHQPRHTPSLNIAAAAAEATQGSDLPVGNMTNTSSGQYHSVQPQAQVNGPSYSLPFSNNSMQYMSGSPLYSNSNNHPLSAGASSHGSLHNARHNEFNNGSAMSMSASSMQTSYDFHHQGSLQSPSHSDLISSHPFDNPGMFPVKAKRKQVKNACVNCQKACKRCDEGRPCSRCVKYGLTATCMDSARKERKRGIKRGPYKRRATTGSQPAGTNWGNSSYLHSSSSSLMLGHGNGYNNSSHHHPHHHHHGMALHSAPLYSTTQPMRSNSNEGQTSFNDVSRSPIEHLPHGSTDSLINNTSAPATVQRSTIPLNSLSYDTASSTSPSMYGRDHNSSNNFLNASSNHHRLHNSESGLAILSNGSTGTTSSILSPRTPIGSSETSNNVVGEYHLTSTSPGGQQKMNGNNTTTSSLTNLTTGAFLNPMNQSGNSAFPLHLPQAARLRGMNNGSTSLPLSAFSNEKSSMNNLDSRPRYNNSYSHDEAYTPVNGNHNNEVENFEVDRASQYLPRKRFVASSPIVRPLL